MRLQMVRDSPPFCRWSCSRSLRAHRRHPQAVIPNGMVFVGWQSDRSVSEEQ